MKVRATALLARKALLVRQFGEARVTAFLEEFGRGEPAFKELTLMPVSEVPAPIFLALNDALVGTFYGGKVDTYWTFGEESAEWAFKEGPFKVLFSTQDFLRFVEMTPAIWRLYFDLGRLEVRHEPQALEAELKILEVPIPHLYFEYSVLGFFRRGLELTGGIDVQGDRLKGFSAGDREVHYRYRWASAVKASPTST